MAELEAECDRCRQAIGGQNKERADADEEMYRMDARHKLQAETCGPHAYNYYAEIDEDIDEAMRSRYLLPP